MQVTGAIRCPTTPSSYVTHLYGVEGNAGDGCNTLSHETLVILDGAERLSGVIENADKLLY